MTETKDNEEPQEWEIIIPIHSATKKNAETHATHIKERLNDKPTYYPEVYLTGFEIVKKVFKI